MLNIFGIRFDRVINFEYISNQNGNNVPKQGEIKIITI